MARVDYTELRALVVELLDDQYRERFTEDARQLVPEVLDQAVELLPDLLQYGRRWDRFQIAAAIAARSGGREAAGVE